MKKILSPKIQGSGPARLANKLRSLVADDTEIAAIGGQIAIYEAWALDGDRVKVQVELRLPDQSYRMLTRVVSFPLPPEIKVSYRDWTIVVTPSWYGFGWRLLDESEAAAGESSEDVGEADYAIENGRREVNRQLGERVAREFQARNPSRGHKAPAPVTPPSIPVSLAPPAAGITENKSLATIQTSSLAQVGESDGAMEKLARLARELLGESFQLTMPANEGDAAVILDWLRSGSKAESPKTQREYLRDVCGPTTGFLTFVGAKLLAAVTRQDVQNYRDALKAVVIPATARRAEHSLAASSQIRMLASVKGLLTHANGIGYAPFNPGKGVALPSLPESKRDKALSQSQSMKMLVTAQNRAEATETEKRAKTRWRDYLLNEVCYFTGGRISEVLALRWRDIYATDKGGEMKIVRGKGRKERVISLPEGLFEALQAMRADRRAGDEDFVFTSQKGGQLSISQAWRIVNALAKEANISKKMSPHGWRHSIATQLLDAGAPLHKVSSFLGHSDPKITVKAYYSESEGLKVEDFIDVE
jgi:site-specific recombinase XerD